MPHRSEQVDTTVFISSLNREDPLPTAPNFFHEVVNSPGNLSISFTPASPEEHEWRMTFYDRYLEWDASILESRVPSTTPEHVIDFFTERTLDTTGETYRNPTSTPIMRSLESVSDPGSFQLLGPKITIIPQGTNFNLTA